MSVSGKNSLKAIMLPFVLTSSAHASIIINEIDYDQPGADTAEFIELYNAGDASTSLDGYTINLINGNDGLSYRTIDLSGFNLAAGDYFVVCDNTDLVANCDYDFTTSTSWFQNGAPDAIALYSGSSLLDSLSYEGSMTGFTEGTMLSVADDATLTASLARLPNGLDSNDNNLDFALGCITPGTANIAGSGDCSALSTVPVPASIWLLGSGAIGLFGFARRKPH